MSSAPSGNPSPPDGNAAATETTTDQQTTGEGTPAAEGQPETFSREYVEKLRTEAAEGRTKAKTADTLTAALVTAYAEATGKLADARDLPHGPELLGEDGVPDRAKVAAAVDALLTDRPHLAARRPRGDIGQGVQPEEGSIGLADVLRAGAG